MSNNDVNLKQSGLWVVHRAVINDFVVCGSKTHKTMHKLNCNARTSDVNNYYYCCIRPEGLL